MLVCVFVPSYRAPLSLTSSGRFHCIPKPLLRRCTGQGLPLPHAFLSDCVHTVSFWLPCVFQNVSDGRAGPRALAWPKRSCDPCRLYRLLATSEVCIVQRNEHAGNRKGTTHFPRSNSRHAGHCVPCATCINSEVSLIDDSVPSPVSRPSPPEAFETSRSARRLHGGHLGRRQMRSLTRNRGRSPRLRPFGSAQRALQRIVGRV